MNAERKRVLFVDDERYFSKRYRAALRERFEVVYCETYGEARDELMAAHKCEMMFDALVLDVMMPPPEMADPAITAEGFETGLWLLVGVKEWLNCVPPTVLLTNRKLDHVREGLKRRGFDADDARLMLCSKTDTKDSDLPQLVEELIARQ